MGKDVEIQGELAPHALTPDDVPVQVLTGPVDAHGELHDLKVIAMECASRQGAGQYLFRAASHPKKSGLCGYAIRVLPKHSDAVGPFWPPLVTWASETSAARGTGAAVEGPATRWPSEFH